MAFPFTHAKLIAAIGLLALLVSPIACADDTEIYAGKQCTGNKLLPNTLSFFTAPAITVNAFNRLAHRDDLYFSVFMPVATPDWQGNLKHYRLSGIPAKILDAGNKNAIDDGTGLFSANTTSLWTSPKDAPDGNKVTSGGAASLLGTGRNLYTYAGKGSPGNVSLAKGHANLLNERNPSLTTSLLGMPASASTDEVSRVIRWARGVDVKDVNGNGDITDARHQLGDILHSRPVLMTYGGSEASPDISLFVGDNQGFLHAFDAITGKEQFGFIPRELLANQHTLYNNAAGVAHPYGMDGPLSLWHYDANADHLLLNPDGTLQAGEFVYLYAGMRRGGNSYYAFDVSDRSKPVLKWQITGGNGEFAELGQTWSRPVVAKIRLHGVDRHVLFFAGGYDTHQDTSILPTRDKIGRAIYMIDAATGQRLWWASSDASADLVLGDMTNSIPSDVTVLDLNNDGYADRLYVGDTGGRIWRIDIDNTNNDTGKFATGGLLARLSGKDAANNRRFYYAPDVAMIRSSKGYALSVTIGSGYRAHPLNKTVMDRFYMIRDDDAFRLPADNNADDIPDYPGYTEAGLYDATANNPGQATGAARKTARNALQTAHGWYIRLDAPGDSNAGEKVLAASITIQGAVAFTTYTPPVINSKRNPCVRALGTGKSYMVNLLDATPIYDNIADGVFRAEDRAAVLVRGGIPPTPTIIFRPGAQLVQCVGTQCRKLDSKGITRKSYWRQDK